MKSKTASTELTALGGDVFAGLFTVGVQQAGYRILGHLEHTTYGTPTARLNFPELDIRNGVHNWNPRDFKNRVNFMYTNPPCAAWSTMRQDSTPWYEHVERLQIVRDLVTAGVIINPDAWCWESVCGAWMQGREFVLEQAEVFMSYGYHVTVLLQNNMYIGSVQDRKRMFLIAHKHPLVWPAFTKPRTAGEILRRVKEPRNPIVKPGQLSSLHDVLWDRSANVNGSLLRVFNTLTEKERAKLSGAKPLAVYRRLNSNAPFPVMLEAGKRLHPDEPRILTWAEWLAACGLPATWKPACGGFTQATLELSRAVMPGVGQWLGQAVAAGLREPALNPRRPIATLVDFRVPDRAHEEVLMTFARPSKMALPEWNPTPPVEPVKKPREPRTTRVPSDKAPRAGGGIAKPGSGVRIRELIQDGKDTQTILDIIHSEFPQSKATSSDVSWNRGRLRKQGINV